MSCEHSGEPMPGLADVLLGEDSRPGGAGQMNGVASKTLHFKSAAMGSCHVVTSDPTQLGRSHAWMSAMQNHHSRCHPDVHSDVMQQSADVTQKFTVMSCSSQQRSRGWFSDRTVADQLCSEVLPLSVCSMQN